MSTGTISALLSFVFSETASTVMRISPGAVGVHVKTPVLESSFASDGASCRRYVTFSPTGAVVEKMMRIGCPTAPMRFPTGLRLGGGPATTLDRTLAEAT